MAYKIAHGHSLNRPYGIMLDIRHATGFRRRPSLSRAWAATVPDRRFAQELEYATRFRDDGHGEPESFQKEKPMNVAVLFVAAAFCGAGDATEPEAEPNGVFG